MCLELGDVTMTPIFPIVFLNKSVALPKELPIPSRSLFWLFTSELMSIVSCKRKKFERVIKCFASRISAFSTLLLE